MVIFIESWEKDYFEPILSACNPTHYQYQCIAKYSPTLSHRIKKSLLNADKSHRANKKATHWLYNKSSLSRYLTTSAQAIDTSKAGVKSRALPEYIETVINHRDTVESTVDEVYNHDLLHAERLTKKFDLGLVSEGGHPS